MVMSLETRRIDVIMPAAIARDIERRAMANNLSVEDLCHKILSNWLYPDMGPKFLNEETR